MTSHTTFTVSGNLAAPFFAGHWSLRRAEVGVGIAGVAVDVDVCLERLARLVAMQHYHSVEVSCCCPVVGADGAATPDRRLQSGELPLKRKADMTMRKGGSW